MFKAFSDKYSPINREMVDWDVESVEEFSSADSYRLPMQDQVLSYIDAGKTNLRQYKEKTDPKIIEAYNNEDNFVQKMKLLLSINIEDALDLVISSTQNDKVRNYLASRIKFYYDLINGNATRIAQNDEEVYSHYDPERGNLYFHYKKGDVIPISGVDLSPESVHLGLFRDIFYAQMIGTPELAVYKIAQQRLEKKKQLHLPKLRGRGCDTIIGIAPTRIVLGRAIPFFHKVYQDALRDIRNKRGDREKILPDSVYEHDAIKLASDWVVRSMTYNSINRGPESPYVSTAEEAVVWSRLGSQVQRQLKGMRNKIMGIKLHGISRFIGKSGDTEYYLKRQELKKQLKEMADDDPERSKLVLSLEETEKKYAQHASLMQRALDLFFWQREFEGTDSLTIDWINNAPYGLIKWTHNAILRGVSKKTAFGYAKAVFTFPNATIDKRLIEMSTTLSDCQILNIRSITTFNKSIGLVDTPEQLFCLKNVHTNVYQQLIQKGYPFDSLVKNPWLIVDETAQLPIGDEFPCKSNEAQQRSWCVRHAFFKPLGWNSKRLGSIILGRLRMGVDTNLHDATYWLQEFDVPEQKHDIVYKNHNLEISLLYSITNVTENVAHRLPTSSNKYEILFSDEATQFIYESILLLVGKGEIEFDKIVKVVNARLSEYQENPRQARSLKIPFPLFREKVDNCINELEILFNHKSVRDPAPKIIGELKVIGENRTNYINTAQKWVENHASTPRTLLTLAWANRDIALADGCEDNPRAIKNWADLHALRSTYETLLKNGQLPANIEKKDLSTYENWFKELIRCYDGNTVFNFFSKIKEKYNPEAEITAIKIDLGNGFVGEVLPKNDPRGATIGYDTGCCMTLKGASESCIHAGYMGASYGFFALYKDGILVAQSFLYNNKEHDSRTIVCDNIEANEGRDKSKIIELYQRFWQKYLELHLRRSPLPRFSRVHVGEGYSSVGLSELSIADSVPMKNEGINIYTDALRQRLLLNLEAENVEQLKKIKASIIKPIDWPRIRSAIMQLEVKAFESKGYSEAELEKEFTDPKNIIIVLRDGDQIIGYTSAIPENKDSLYISSTAILPKYQGQGFVSDLMAKLDTIAVGRGYQYYERHAAVENGYAEKLKRNYEIIEESEYYSDQYGKQKYFKMKIPQPPSSNLDGVQEIKPPKEKLYFSPLEYGQSQIVAELEREIYPDSLVQPVDDWRDELQYEATKFDGGNASFLIMEHGSGEPIPVGYAIAYIANAEIDTNYSPFLYVRDLAIRPEKQNLGFGRLAMQQLIEFAQSRQNMPIEFYARESTSYQAIKKASIELLKLGYKIVSEELDEDHVDSGENFYLLRLERVKEERKAA